MGCVHEGRGAARVCMRKGEQHTHGVCITKEWVKVGTSRIVKHCKKMWLLRNCESNWALRSKYLSNCTKFGNSGPSYISIILL